MSDIVERLRTEAPSYVLIGDAAIEIERLQKEADELHYKLRFSYQSHEEQEERIKTLEGWLNGSLNMLEKFVMADTSQARAALEGK